MAAAGEADPETSADLAARARGGDDGALDRLLERHYDHVLAVVRRRLGAELRRFHDSVDVVQEAMVEAVRSRAQAEALDEAAFRRWMAGVVENRLRDLAKYHGAAKRDRRGERHVESLAPASGDFLGDVHGGDADRTPSAVVSEREQQELVAAALAGLDPERRRAVELRLAGLEWGAVARELGLPSAGAARMLHARALTELARRAAGPDAGPE